jgi:leucyl aminopeptidase
VAPADIASFALGALLRGYKFKKYKTKTRKKNDAAAETNDRTLKKIVIHCADPKAAGQAFAPARAMAEGVTLAAISSTSRRTCSGRWSSPSAPRRSPRSASR